MRNSDLEQQLVDLETAAAGLRQAVAGSDTLPALSLAGALVESARLNAALAKLSKKVQAVAAPLFKNGQAEPAGDDAAGGARPRPRK